MGTFRSRYHFQKHLLYLTKIKILSNPPRLLCANLSNTQRVSCHSLSLTRRTLQSNTILLDCESSGNGDDRRSSESSNPWIDKLYSKSTAASPAFDVDELRRDDNVIEGRRTSGVEELSNGDDDVLAKDWAAAIEAGFDYGSKDESSAGEDCGLSQNESRDIYDSDRHLMTDEDDDVGEKKEEELSCSEEESMNESGFVSGDILPERVGINVIHGVGKVGVEESSNGDNHKSGTKSAKNWNPGDFVSNNKKGKSKMAWVCSNCGHSAVQWFGICSECKQADTMKQFSVAGPNDGNKTRGFEVSEDATRSWLKQNSKLSFPQRVTDVIKGINQEHWRFELHGPFGAEVARVLGGGLVPGSLVLVGGDPGVGKSTLILQLAALLSDGTSSYESAPVVYVSGEESIEQIGNRADRMGILSQDLFLYSCTDVEDILKKVQQISPRALIIDSIQTVYLKGVIGSAGSLSQVKECTSALLRFAKTTDIPVMLIGHVTKSGEIAGPRVLEHIVDAVLYMEGEMYSAHRFLRSVKNRFGSTDELGVFEMSESGLQAVSNPSEIFLGEQHMDSDVLVGLAVAVIIDGSRTFLIEIQALCIAEAMSASKHFNGVKAARADMILSVLMKQAGLKLQNNAIFVNVVSGVKLEETAGDLAMAAAICSSFLEFPVPNDVAFIGEIGLCGELRAVPRMEKRIIAVAKLGYKKCIIPKSTERALTSIELGDMMIVGCKSLKEVINTVFVGE